jgi:hypothetical protein
VDTVNANRVRHVFDRLLAHVLETEKKLIAHLVVHYSRDAYTAWLGRRLETCRDVDAVAIDVVVIADDVADVEADAEQDSPVRGHLRVALHHSALNVDRAAYCVDNADEFNQHAVASRLHDATAVLDNLRVHESLAVTFEVPQSPFLIGAHEPAVSGNVTCQYRR